MTINSKYVDKHICIFSFLRVVIYLFLWKRFQWIGKEERLTINIKAVYYSVTKKFLVKSEAKNIYDLRLFTYLYVFAFGDIRYFVLHSEIPFSSVTYKALYHIVTGQWRRSGYRCLLLAVTTQLINYVVTVLPAGVNIDYTVTVQSLCSYCA